MMDLWEIYKASKGVPHSGDLYDALMGKSLGGGSVWETETAPYLFRPSGGVLGSRLLGKEKDCIVGVSVPWNQLVNSGDTSVTVTSGHKYYANINNSKTIGSSNGSAISINDSTKDNVVDLTLMLGSTIADYAYTLETQQAGKGIQWLRSYGFLDKPYYAYDNGSLQSVNAVEHKTVGFNQWDEEWETGFYNVNTGAKENSSSQIRCKNKISILPNTTYWCQSPKGTWGLFFDADNNLIIGYNAATTTAGNATLIGSNKQFITPPNGAYMVFYMVSEYGTTYNHDICINISNASLNGQYQPYEAHEYPLADLELRGVFKMDADHKIYAEGDTYESSGVVTRKYPEIELSNLAWTYNSTYSCWQSTGISNSVKRYPTQAEMVNALAEKYVCDTVGNLTGANFTDGKFIIGTSGNLFIKTGSSENSPTGKFIYELATPTTDTAEPFASPQNVDKDGTEEYVCTQKFVPIGHSTEYKCTPTP